MKSSLGPCLVHLVPPLRAHAVSRVFHTVEISRAHHRQDQILDPPTEAIGEGQTRGVPGDALCHGGVSLMCGVMEGSTLDGFGQKLEAIASRSQGDRGPRATNSRHGGRPRWHICPQSRWWSRHCGWPSHITFTRAVDARSPRGGSSGPVGCPQQHHLVLVVHNDGDPWTLAASPS